MAGGNRRHKSLFQSTLPAGEATRRPWPSGGCLTISIHASRGGSDYGQQYIDDRNRGNFNPRFPRGKRLAPKWWNEVSEIFQSTLPAGEATLLEEGESPYDHGFQSTLPAGEATDDAAAQAVRQDISIHASRGGSDLQQGPLLKRNLPFQSTLPAGEATRHPHSG